MNVISYGTIPFTFSGNTAFVNSVYGREIDINTVKNIGEVLCGSSGSIVDVCGGEWIFNNFNCHIVESRGSNRNVVLQYGYDINECNRDIEIQTAYTHIFPYYELFGDDIRQGFRYKRVPHITLKSIANNEQADEEVLYDQPEENKRKIRVSGPFTVETLQSFNVTSPEKVDHSKRYGS